MAVSVLILVSVAVLSVLAWSAYLRPQRLRIKVEVMRLLRVELESEMRTPPAPKHREEV